MSGIPPRETRLVLALVAIAFLARVGFAFATGATEGEGRGYVFYAAMADRLLDGEGLKWQVPTDGGWRYAHRTPLYPIVLAGLRGTFGRSPIPVVIFQSLLAAASVFVLHRLGRRLVGPPCACLAAAAFALYPYCVGNDTAYGEQPLLTLLSLLLLLAADGAGRAPTAGRWLLVGALGGLCVLARASWWPAIVLLSFVAMRRSPGTFLRRVAMGGWLLAGMYAAGAPWLVRNYEMFGHLTWSTDRGRALWIGNDPQTFDAYPWRSIDESEILAWQGMDSEVRGKLGSAAGDEIRQDRLYLGLGALYVRENPGEFLLRGLRKVGAQYDVRLTPEPDSAWKLWAYSLSYGPALLLALLGLARIGARRRLFLPWFALVAGTAVVAFVFWGQTRLRVSLDPPMLCLAAVGFAALPGGRRVVARLARSLASPIPRPESSRASGG